MRHHKEVWKWKFNLIFYFNTTFRNAQDVKGFPFAFSNLLRIRSNTLLLFSLIFLCSSMKWLVIFEKQLIEVVTGTLYKEFVHRLIFYYFIYDQYLWPIISLWSFYAKLVKHKCWQDHTQPAFACSKSTVETPEHCVKSVRS